MTTKLKVYNNCLDLLGEPPATSTEDTSKWVKRITNAYDDVVDGLLEDHSWNFAMTVKQLAVVTPTLVGFTYTFNKPTKCKRIIKVDNSTDPRGIGIEYDDRQGKILTNSETSYIWYVDGTWKDNEGSWSQKFADFVAAKIADRIYPITDESNSTRDRIEKQLLRRGRDAKAWDATSKREWPIPPGRYERARTAGIRTPRAGRYG